MTLRFVKTSILSSDDGIGFGKEVAVESEEVMKVRISAETASKKPLYQQLADIRDRKKEEYDENTKKLFAPPKGLDEDDVQFFDELDEAKARAVDYNKRHDEIELEAFREYRKMEILKEGSETVAAPSIVIPPKKVEQPIHTGVVLKGRHSTLLQFFCVEAV